MFLDVSPHWLDDQSYVLLWIPYEWPNIGAISRNVCMLIWYACTEDFLWWEPYLVCMFVFEMIEVTHVLTEHIEKDDTI